MAPELALEKLAELPTTCTVLDPMAGSGTVLRQAIDLGHQAIGFDMDPLAVLMTRVWTAAVDDSLVADIAHKASALVDTLAPDDARLPWMDEDPETQAFVDFWFAEPQKIELRRIAHVLDRLGAEATSPEEDLALDVLRIALSRLIITKDKGASLARDVSHSRPHKVAQTNDFAVRPMFERSIIAVRRRLAEASPPGGAAIDLGDARSLGGLADGSIDAVLTSPPYLNAIDYMRGHRLSLVWLGHRLDDLRAIRSNSIGSERSPDRADHNADLAAMRVAMGELNELPAKFARMIDRYVQDIQRMIAEIARVLKAGGRATFVVGNSCLRGVFIRNSAAVATAAHFAGLTLTGETERPLPTQSRYLPMTSVPLGKRMRTETILSFARV
jgi:SAM-dependent methyltransferase